MTKIILSSYRLGILRTQELESLNSSISKTKDKEKLARYRADVKNIEEQKKKYKKKAEKCIKKLNLSEEEKQMAKLYYMEAKTWPMAFDNSIYQTLSEKRCSDEEFVQKLYEASRKKIQRAVNENF